jgi:hypothetical protein
MGLSESDFAAAHGCDSFAGAWEEFLKQAGPSPVLAGWNQRTLDLLARISRRRRPEVVLKGAYRAVFGTDAHTLEEIVAQRGLALAPNGFKGRAGKRLSGAVAIARLLNARARSEGSENSRTSNIGQIGSG